MEGLSNASWRAVFDSGSSPALNPSFVFAPPCVVPVPLSLELLHAAAASTGVRPAVASNRRQCGHHKPHFSPKT
jgi:hypothetical protein